MSMIVQPALNEDTTHARKRAEEVLRSLLNAKEQTERELSEQRRSDAMRLVTGRTSIDNAIDETRRLIGLLDRAGVESFDPVVTVSGIGEPAGAFAGR